MIGKLCRRKVADIKKYEGIKHNFITSLSSHFTQYKKRAHPPAWSPHQPQETKGRRRINLTQASSKSDDCVTLGCTSLKERVISRDVQTDESGFDIKCADGEMWVTFADSKGVRKKQIKPQFHPLIMAMIRVETKSLSKIIYQASNHCLLLQISTT